MKSLYLIVIIFINGFVCSASEQLDIANPFLLNMNRIILEGSYNILHDDEKLALCNATLKEAETKQQRAKDELAVVAVLVHLQRPQFKRAKKICSKVHIAEYATEKDKNLARSYLSEIENQEKILLTKKIDRVKSFICSLNCIFRQKNLRKTFVE